MEENENKEVKKADDNIMDDLDAIFGAAKKVENPENKEEAQNTIPNDETEDIVDDVVDNIVEDVVHKQEPIQEAKTPDAVVPGKEQELQEQLKDLDDRYKRLFAEFENYKKRTQKESLDKYNYITSDVINKILPVMDNLQNAVNAKTEDKAYQEGVKMVLDQLNNCFRNLNVEEIVATPGTKFDPEYHEAVQHLDDPSKGVNEIIQEFRKGYKIGNKVIRHSMVIVAN